MALSPQYGWAEPDNSSLVKNGAADIRTLGDAIDTSVWNVGYGQAGKNKIINGDFGIWQRGTSFTPASGVVANTADRFTNDWGGTGTATFSRQSFTAGAAPVAGYESSFFLRAAMPAGGTYVSAGQRVEDVRTFAGNTVTFSFWAKATSSITFTPYFRQSFGSGGSADVDTLGSPITLTSTWTRYTSTVTLPSISGKTIGTSSYLWLITVQTGGTVASNSIDYWGWQLEYGSKATPFQTATGTIQGELAACQRYYFVAASGIYAPIGMGTYTSAGTMITTVFFKETMRTAPTLAASSGTDFYNMFSNGANDLFNSLTLDAVYSTNSAQIFNNAQVSGTSGTGGLVYTNNASSSVAFSAEL